MTEISFLHVMDDQRDGSHPPLWIVLFGPTPIIARRSRDRRMVQPKAITFLIAAKLLRSATKALNR